MVSKRIVVSPEDRAELERIVRSRRAERRMVERAEVVLGAAEGFSAREIAERVGCSEKLADRWRARYERYGIEGLRDRPRSGRPLTHGPEPGLAARVNRLRGSPSPARPSGPEPISPPPTNRATSSSGAHRRDARDDLTDP